MLNLFPDMPLMVRALILAGAIVVMAGIAGLAVLIGRRFSNAPSESRFDIESKKSKNAAKPVRPTAPAAPAAPNVVIPASNSAPRLAAPVQQPGLAPLPPRPTLAAPSQPLPVVPAEDSLPVVEPSEDQGGPFGAPKSNDSEW
jgi:hypothetical protein